MSSSQLPDGVSALALSERRSGPRARVGRAELAWLLNELPPQGVATAAALLGFREEQPAVKAHSDSCEIKKRQDEKKGDQGKPAAGAPPRAEPVMFWRMESVAFHDDQATLAEQRTVRDEERAILSAVWESPRDVGPLTHEDLTSPGCSLRATPRPSPLTPWSRLWPLLRAALQASIPGRDPDVPALVRVWGRGEVVRRIPRLRRRVWAERASVWVDYSPRLVPFRSDQVEVCGRLRVACGKTGFRVRRLDAYAQAMMIAERGDLLEGFQPDKETPVLVLGDLGVFGTAAEREAWLRTEEQLRRAGVRVAALIPAPRERWSSEIATAWHPVPWEAPCSTAKRSGGRHHTSLPPDPGLRGLDPSAGGESPREGERTPAERLLRLASAAALVQPGLLRALRLLLPASDVSVATEADAWTHSDVKAADVTGMVLHADAARRWREELVKEESPELLARATEIIGRWHARMPRELLRLERVLWTALAPVHAAIAAEDREDALNFVGRLEVSLCSGREATGPAAAAVRRCAGAMLASMPNVAYNVVPTLKKVWAATFESVTGVRVPEALKEDLDRLYEELGTVGAPRWWAVRQVGAQMVFFSSSNAAWPSANEGPGSPVAWLLAAGERVWVTDGGRGSDDEAETQYVLEDSLSMPLPTGERLILRTDCCTVTLTCWSPEPWVAASGRDRFGLWAEADVGGVAVRFRWIPPGRFWMGSPENEAGRYEDEGPRHRVTWTDGRWLCDTPVTQALWGKVMGDNPSRFKSPERPVEQVSWEDCQKFLEKLNARVPGLKARLPSEAEWEHACRAGTETATWKGDLEILGKHNAPLLDDIAWYGGNCGVDFELEGGHATTVLNWDEKPHEFEKGGTHPVRQRLPNPLGLFDMLGNVYEWCIDAAEDYSPAPYVGKAVSDPAPNGTGSLRVIRGGSWHEFARFVRAARRYARDPGLRDDDLGFRLARGQAPGPRSGASGGAAERAPNRDAGRGTVPAPPRDAAAPSPFPSPSRRDPKGGRGGR